MVQYTPDNPWDQFPNYILALEKDGFVTRTYRRLDPDRQQAVLHAILQEAYRRGPSNLNIKEVAKIAGVSVGSLYTYFPNRDGLLDFAIELSVRYICDEFESFKPLLEGLPLREALTFYIAGGVEWSKTQIQILRLFARAAYQGDPDLEERLVRPIATTMRQFLEELVRQAVARGEVRADLDIDTLTRYLHTFTIAVGDSLLMPYLNTYFQVYEGEPDPMAISSQLVDLLIRGITPAENSP